MAVIFKCFTTHKRGENDEDIQDSICVNSENGRFALSDGVSQSFLPRLFADILTESFVAVSDNAVFPDNNLPELFQKRKDAYISSLDEFGATLQEIAEETFKNAAATFVGLEIKDQQVSWKVLGDSCLFIIPDEGTIQCICSEEVKMEPNGSIHVSFGKTPAQIQSDGKVFGDFIIGSAKSEVGWYVLMSDTISEWFINRYNNGENVAQMLFNLESDFDFENLIEKEYQAKRIKSDDCSAILIRVEDDESGGSLHKDEPSPDYFNDIKANEDVSMKSSKRRVLNSFQEQITFLVKKIKKIISFAQS